MIIKTCTEDFEWYLELWPTHYKAIYYLIRINLGKNDDKCHELLLPRSRRPDDDTIKPNLFDIHRKRHLFKVHIPNTNSHFINFIICRHPFSLIF